MSSDATTRLRMKCIACRAEYEQDLVFANLRRYAGGAFKPIPCLQCNQEAAAPTIRPYKLTVLDRRFLRSMKILPDDDVSCPA